MMTDSLIRIVFIEKDIITRRSLCPPNKVYNKVMAYLRRCLALLAALVLSLSAYAASMEFSISPSIDVADYIASAEGVTEVDLSDDVAKGFAVSAGIFGDIYPWLSAGGVAYVDVRSLINEDEVNKFKNSGIVRGKNNVQIIVGMKVQDCQTAEEKEGTFLFEWEAEDGYVNTIQFFPDDFQVV